MCTNGQYQNMKGGFSCVCNCGLRLARSEEACVGVCHLYNRHVYQQWVSEHDEQMQMHLYTLNRCAVKKLVSTLFRLLFGRQWYYMCTIHCLTFNCHAVHVLVSLS